MLLRITWVVAVAALATACLAALLFVLPKPFALACAFSGLVAFMTGAELEGLKWPTLIGGVFMFGGVVAAALNGALG